MLRMCGVRPERVIEVLSSDERPECREMVVAWFKLFKNDRRMLGLEGVAIIAGLTPLRVWELYASASLKQTKSCVEIMLADALPQIMRVAIKDAKRAKGIASREHMLKASRILPTPKGAVTNINFPGGKSEDAQLPDGGADGILEPADEFLMKASKAMNPPALPARAQDAEILDAEPMDEEIGE